MSCDFSKMRKSSRPRLRNWIAMPRPENPLPMMATVVSRSLWLSMVATGSGLVHARGSFVGILSGDGKKAGTRAA